MVSGHLWFASSSPSSSWCRPARRANADRACGRFDFLANVSVRENPVAPGSIFPGRPFPEHALESAKPPPARGRAPPRTCAMSNGPRSRTPNFWPSEGRRRAFRGRRPRSDACPFRGVAPARDPRPLSDRTARQTTPLNSISGRLHRPDRASISLGRRPKLIGHQTPHPNRRGPGLTRHLPEYRLFTLLASSRTS